MAKVYDWIKLGLDNWKTILSIITLIAGVIGSSTWGWSQSEEATSYKMGYEALAQNVSQSTRQDHVITDDKTMLLRNHEIRIQKLERHH